jgi:two-component system sensor histidine kinase CiaH
MFRSATVKLTAYYLLIVMVISFGFSMVLFRVATVELRRGLHQESQRILAQFPVFKNSPMIGPRSDIDDSTHRILVELLFFNTVVLVSAGFASYLLARRTLLPIEEAHNQQKRFTADVSHELRTPLTALRMESEVSLMDPTTSKQDLRKTLLSNVEEVEKMETLINSLLRLTKLENVHLQDQFQTLYTDSLVDAAIDRIRKTADDRHITFTTTTTTTPLLGDQDSAIQLVVILLDNAIKYSANGTGIEIASGIVDKHAYISITDHGIGIARKDLDHVFDRFYRSDSSRGKTTDGYGLGLSIAKMIADAHQATILLKSQLGRGTTATINFRTITS